MRMTRSGRASWACAFLLSAAASAARPASATVKAGGSEASVNFGGAWPTVQIDVPNRDASGVNQTGNKTENLGGMGTSFGGQYLYHLTPALGLGGEFDYASFGDEKHSITCGGADCTREISSYKMWSLEAVVRYVLMPDARVNPYFIAGVGWGQTSAKAAMTPLSGYYWPDNNGTETRTAFDTISTGPAFSLGAGVDADITDALFAGLDVRWRTAGAKKTSGAYSVPAGAGLGIAGKLGWKFGG